MKNHFQHRLASKLLIILLVLASAAAITARTKTSLNTGWRFHKADIADAKNIGFDDSAWTRINIPHTWNIDDPWDDEPGYHRGAAWYRRQLMIPKSPVQQRYFLYFEGANQIADVYVNGEKAGSHIGGYSAFALDITDLVKPGRNMFAVRVDNSFNEDIPPLTGDFNFYGGIYRDVWLIATSNTHLKVTDHASPGVRITTPHIAEGLGTVAIEGTVMNAGEGVSVVSTIVDAANRKVGESIARTSTDRFSNTVLVQSPKLWSPESPYLYSVRISVRRGGKILDEIVQPLGFRWFEFDGAKGFSLNGKPLKLRGTNRHQDHAGLGNALPDRLHIRDMQIVKDAGFNFVRLAHYPQDPAILEACDRLGLLVWEETPLVNYITDSAAFAANSEQMMREMVRQHRNHPSVLLWGYMNEIFLRYPNREDLYRPTIDLARRLDRIAKEEDPTRPTTIAFHENEVYNRTGLGEVADVIGWNLYQGWYSQTVTEFGKFMDDQHARYPKRPLIVSEYGANSDRRLHSSAPRRFDSTTDYQRHFHESYLAQIDARPFISASAIWNQFDFGSEFRGETIPHLNQKGMYTFDRRPKDIHFFYKARLSDRTVLHLAVSDTPVRAGLSGEMHAIDVYSNLDSVELLVNGRPLGRRQVREAKASWQTILRPGINTLVARAAKGKTIVSDSATITFRPYDVTSNEIAINVGSNADFIDDTGLIWIADQAYAAGKWGFVGEASKRIYSQPPDRNIHGTKSDPLFQTMIEAASRYRLDVPAGEYEVELLFAETGFDQPGKRVFDVSLNGKRVLESLDLARLAGRNVSVRRQFTTSVATDGIAVEFTRRTGEPVLSGVRVRRLRR